MFKKYEIENKFMMYEVENAPQKYNINCLIHLTFEEINWRGPPNNRNDV